MPRRPDGDRAMTDAERQRLYRARLRQARGPRPTLAALREEIVGLKRQHAMLAHAAREEIKTLRQRIRDLEGER